jgi:hypothetical protein
LKHLISSLFLLLLAAGAVAENAAVSPLKAAVGAAVKAPRSQSTLRQLYAQAGKVDHLAAEEQLRVALVLGLRLNGQKSASGKMAEAFDKKFPNSALYKRMQDHHLSEDCGTCGGEALAREDCTTCKGTGKCGNSKCKGGEVRTPGFQGAVKVKTCPVCKGKMTCAECNGNGAAMKPCKACRGQGQSVTKDRIEHVYVTILGELDVTLTALAAEQQAAERAAKQAVDVAAGREVAAEKREAALAGDGEYDVALAEDQTSESLANTTQIMVMWLNAQQRRMESQPVERLYAVADGGIATLNLETGDAFSNASEEWRAQFVDSCEKFWRVKCSQMKTGRFKGTVKFVAAE